jgi:hypothetical protein
VAAAEKYNQPGVFTALIGFEWTSSTDGNNLHRIVLMRDNADRALQVLPLPSLTNPDPEALWQYLASYQEKTGGQALAIPHNSNLSGGMMFADHTFSGKPFDRAYAEARQKWEPLVEASQTKGDSETHPLVSPDDEFANFERWDKANILRNRPDKPEEQPFNYVRPTLTRGLKYEATLGANPFKFGLIAATDSHTGLSTADADNFFGAIPPTGEPNPHRIDNLPSLGKITAKSRFTPTPLMEVSSGLSAVWATSNTREAIYDAFRRKEVYGRGHARLGQRAGAAPEPVDRALHPFPGPGNRPRRSRRDQPDPTPALAGGLRLRPAARVRLRERPDRDGSASGRDPAGPSAVQCRRGAGAARLRADHPRAAARLPPDGAALAGGACAGTGLRYRHRGLVLGLAAARRVFWCAYMIRQAGGGKGRKAGGNEPFPPDPP